MNSRHQLSTLVLTCCLVSTAAATTSLERVKSAEESFVCIEGGRNVTALILARGGSKGIPLKNIAKLDGISLLGRALRTVEEFGGFEDVWVSTDHVEIVKEARKYGANVFKRSPEFAQDETPSIVSVQEFLNKSKEIENLALIQCTSPFLNVKYLEEALEKFQAADCVFSVTRSYKLRWFRNETSGAIQPLNFDPKKRPRRQDWNGEMIENGMFYLAKRELLEKGTFQNHKCDVVDTNVKDSLEIDSDDDLEIAELILKHEKRRKL